MIPCDSKGLPVTSLQKTIANNIKSKTYHESLTYIYIYYWFSFMAHRDYYIYIYQHSFWSSIFSSYIINYPKKPGFWMCFFPERAPSSLNWGLQSQHVGTPGSRSSQGTLRMPRRRAPRKDQAEALEVEVAIIIYIYTYIYINNYTWWIRIIYSHIQPYLIRYDHIWSCIII